jgi:hypothetical protein
MVFLFLKRQRNTRKEAQVLDRKINKIHLIKLSTETLKMEKLSNTNNVLILTRYHVH